MFSRVVELPRRIENGCKHKPMDAWFSAENGCTTYNRICFRCGRLLKSVLFEPEDGRREL